MSRRCRTCSTTRAAASPPWPLAAAELGIDTVEAGSFVEDALFTTLTNVDFDPDDHRRARSTRRCACARASKPLSPPPEAPPSGQGTPLSGFAADLGDKIAQGAELGSPWDTTRDENVQSLQEVTLYGMKGVAAYAHHARTLGQTDAEIDAYLFRALAALATRRSASTSGSASPWSAAR